MTDPFPATARNVAIGASASLLLFVSGVALLAGVAFGVYGFVFAAIVALCLGLLALLVLGLPLTLLTHHLVRASGSPRVHSAAAAAAGGMTGLVVAAIAVGTAWQWREVPWWAVGVLALLAALSAKGGWYVARHCARSRPSPAVGGTS